MSAALPSPPPALSPAAQRELAQDMLLGQHSVSYTADYTRLSEARVAALAEALRKDRRIPRVRA
ncbi:hypothetical protein KTR66_04595 [Roseococcus sp. SDR]|uniref:hypothetical protein n=1 Tax=Roseococcus sp. SDR TaxID=2835532 RepID=UPI001BCF86FC|nr:hypothetical protein [Roseococcus sp. SDR]MBS7789258.1 hypothetical protein [Roseococcus sp. SDR]MBV1844572.1 hypothetical protein [Roseococcus sp. SDR]